jgi:hypothetical protein
MKRRKKICKRGLAKFKKSIIKVSEKITEKKIYVQNEDRFDQDCKDAIAEEK